MPTEFIILGLTHPNGYERTWDETIPQVQAASPSAYRWHIFPGRAWVRIPFRSRRELAKRLMDLWIALRDSMDDAALITCRVGTVDAAGVGTWRSAQYSELLFTHLVSYACYFVGTPETYDSTWMRPQPPAGFDENFHRAFLAEWGLSPYVCTSDSYFQGRVEYAVPIVRVARKRVALFHIIDPYTDEETDSTVEEDLRAKLEAINLAADDEEICSLVDIFKRSSPVSRDGDEEGDATRLDVQMELLREVFEADGNAKGIVAVDDLMAYLKPIVAPFDNGTAIIF